jgi:hypothetical protein
VKGSAAAAGRVLMIRIFKNENSRVFEKFATMPGGDIQKD